GNVLHQQAVRQTARAHPPADRAVVTAGRHGRKIFAESLIFRPGAIAPAVLVVVLANAHQVGNWNVMRASLRTLVAGQAGIGTRIAAHTGGGAVRGRVLNVWTSLEAVAVRAGGIEACQGFSTANGQAGDCRAGDSAAHE